jgi:hypothetical protein
VREDDNVLFFVQTWAEAVVRQLERVRELREKGTALFRAAERVGMEEWDLAEEDSRRNFRVRWVEEHMLIWAAYQLERWSRRLAAERGEKPPEPDQDLARVRNALEHLDEADLEEGVAVPGPLGVNRSLRSLPGERLSIGLGFGDSRFADLISPADLEKRALAAVKKVEDELEAEIQSQVDHYLQMMDE